MYLDYNATYPLTKAHLDEVAARCTGLGNPSSMHAAGRVAKIALEEAREAVSDHFRCPSEQVIFTSGATEANNLAIQGHILQLVEMGKVPEVIIGATEHESVYQSARHYAYRAKGQVKLASVAKGGALDLDLLISQLSDRTDLVCLMHANNETGVRHDIHSVAEMIHRKAPRAHLHVDAVQTFTRLDLSWVSDLPIHSVAVSGHKIGAMTGVGALYLKSGTQLSPHTVGGAQEKARRAGTEGLPAVISLGLRADTLRDRHRGWIDKMVHRTCEIRGEIAKIDGAEIHGEGHALPHTIHFHIDGIPGEDILVNLDLAGISASNGSACSSGSNRPSRVMQAMGYDDWTALNSVRLSFNDDDEIDGSGLVDVIRETIDRVRNR